MRNKIIFWLLTVLLVGCTPIMLHQLDQRFGKPDSTRYAQPTPPQTPSTPEYHRDIQPLLEQRCVVCHGCYDAPCQQNLTSWDGITRGANAELVYSNRLLAAEPSRLYIDAQSPAAWRHKNFHPVLNERENSREANLQGSVLYRLLALKRQQPLPEQAVLDDKDFTFALDRKQTCPKIETMEAFEREHPLWGMPYGLPALSDQEFSTIENWLAAGSPVAAAPAIPVAIRKNIDTWEGFFNAPSLKQQLVSRYIYEHLFLAHLYFDDIQTNNTHQRYFFRLVRSSTAPGEPIAEIATRRPYDDPGTDKFWYRLRREQGSIVEKTHMPYALNAARMQKWQTWFLDKPYDVTTLPSYAPEVASNPFIAFQALPVDSRYRFMLEEAQFSIDNFIKGPVCRGQVALDVIDDHFWVFFVDPDVFSAEKLSAFLAQESYNLRLPAEDESNARVVDWLKYSASQKDFLQAKAEQMERAFSGKNRLNLDLIWDGDKKNPNAALTIFRHSDSATVVKGLVGQPPKTAWLITYPLLERIHYLLVAGFDVYGSLGHQLNTRLYMDFMRMEGESNFLALLPKNSRREIRDFWYRDASSDVKNYLYGKHFNFDVESNIPYHTANPQAELYGLLQQKLGKVLPSHFALSQVTNKTLQQSLLELQKMRGAGLAAFPQNAILRIDGAAAQPLYFTLINNSGYTNNSELFDEQKRRRPAEDYLTVVPGIIGAYPNAFFRVDVTAIDLFARRVAALHTAADYTALAHDFAVRRTNPAFWAFSDALQRDYLRREPVNGGILDYNRFENR